MNNTTTRIQGWLENIRDMDQNTFGLNTFACINIIQICCFMIGYGMVVIADPDDELAFRIGTGLVILNIFPMISIIGSIAFLSRILMYGVLTDFITRIMKHIAKWLLTDRSSNESRQQENV